MPRTKPVSQKIQNQGIVSGILSQFKLGESYTNLILGAVVVIVIGIALLIFAKDNKEGQTSSTATKQAVEEEKEEMASSTYTVKVGDSLWSISEKTYKTGYNWTQIAKANRLENPGVIHAGNKLKLPSIRAASPISEKPTVNDAITGNKYTVKKGDNLWNIAVRAYGDGFRYVEIAKANSLANPDLIHPNNVLAIPRK